MDLTTQSLNDLLNISLLHKERKPEINMEISRRCPTGNTFLEKVFRLMDITNNKECIPDKLKILQHVKRGFVDNDCEYLGNLLYDFKEIVQKYRGELIQKQLDILLNTFPDLSYEIYNSVINYLELFIKKIRKTITDDGENDIMDQVAPSLNDLIIYVGHLKQSRERLRPNKHFKKDMKLYKIICEQYNFIPTKQTFISKNLVCTGLMKPLLSIISSESLNTFLSYFIRDMTDIDITDIFDRLIDPNIKLLYDIHPQLTHMGAVIADLKGIKLNVDESIFKRIINEYKTSILKKSIHIYIYTTYVNYVLNDKFIDFLKEKGTTIDFSLYESKFIIKLINNEGDIRNSKNYYLVLIDDTTENIYEIFSSEKRFFEKLVESPVKLQMTYKVAYFFDKGFSRLGSVFNIYDVLNTHWAEFFEEQYPIALEHQNIDTQEIIFYIFKNKIDNDVLKYLLEDMNVIPTTATKQRIISDPEIDRNYSYNNLMCLNRKNAFNTSDLKLAIDKGNAYTARFMIDFLQVIPNFECLLSAMTIFKSDRYTVNKILKHVDISTSTLNMLLKNPPVPFADVVKYMIEHGAIPNRESVRLFDSLESTDEVLCGLFEPYRRQREQRDVSGLVEAKLNMDKNITLSSKTFLHPPKITTEWMTYCALKDINLAKEKLVAFCNKHQILESPEHMTKHQICAFLSKNLTSEKVKALIVDLCNRKATPEDIRKTLYLSLQEDPSSYVNDAICASVSSQLSCKNKTDLTDEDISTYSEDQVLIDAGYCFTLSDLRGLTDNGNNMDIVNPYTTLKFSDESLIRAHKLLNALNALNTHSKDIHKEIYIMTPVDTAYADAVTKIMQRFNNPYFSWAMFKRLDIKVLNKIIVILNDMMHHKVVNTINEKTEFSNIQVLTKFLNDILLYDEQDTASIMTALHIILDSVGDDNCPYPDIKEYFDKTVVLREREKEQARATVKIDMHMNRLQETEARIAYLNALKHLKHTYKNDKTTAYLYMIFMARENLIKGAKDAKDITFISRQFNAIPELEITLNSLKLLAQLYAVKYGSKLPASHPLSRMLELFIAIANGKYNNLSDRQINTKISFDPKIGSIHIGEPEYMPFYPTIISFISIIDKFRDQKDILERLGKSTEICLNDIFRTLDESNSSKSADDKLNEIVLILLSQPPYTTMTINKNTVLDIAKHMLNEKFYQPVYDHIKSLLMKDKRMTSEEYDAYILALFTEKLLYF